MATLKKYDLEGAEIGVMELDDALLQKSIAHPQSIKDYIVAIRANARQWSANTKTRKEVNRTGRKPHAQKGQGRSRQGDLAAPHYKGGGIVFGPKPKYDQHVRINKKERRAAIRYLIAERVKEGRMCILAEHMQQPKTKAVAQFFDRVQLGTRRVLVVGETKHENFEKSLRNLEKKEYSLVTQVNGYSLALAHDLVVLDTAWDEFLKVLGGA